MNEEEILIIRCKVVLVGESCANKTGIISRFLSNQFSTTNNEVNTYIQKKIIIEEDKFVELDIWDTPGQKEFRPISTMCC